MEMLEASQYLSGERDVLGEDGADSDGYGDGYGYDVGYAQGAAAAASASAASASAASASEGMRAPPQEQEQQGQQHSTNHFYTFLSSKAGMEGVSKEEVARIVHEASVNSRYYKHQERQDEKMQDRIQKIQAKCRTLTEGQRRLLEDRADRELAEAERAHRSYDRVCCVIDLDAFFAAVEERDRPELKVRAWGRVGLGSNFELVLDDGSIDRIDSSPSHQSITTTRPTRRSPSRSAAASSARPPTWRGALACAAPCPPSSPSASAPTSSSSPRASRPTPRWPSKHAPSSGNSIPTSVRARWTRRTWI